MLTAAKFRGGGTWDGAATADIVANPRYRRVVAALTTTAGLYFLLPSALFLKLGGPQVVLINSLASTQSIGVKDGAGNVVATVAAGVALELYLYSNATVAGGWASRSL